MSDGPEDSVGYQKFADSLNLDFYKWHDGIGFDLDTLRKLSPNDKDLAVALLRKREITWREIAAFDAADTQIGSDALRDSLNVSSPDARLHAAQALHRRGLLADFPKLIAEELKNVRIGDGLAFAKKLVLSHDTPEVRRALLIGIRDRPEVAYHFAGALWSMVKQSYDAPADNPQWRPYSLSPPSGAEEWRMGAPVGKRPLFLRLGKQNASSVRRAAWLELCGDLGLDPNSAKD